MKKGFILVLLVFAISWLASCEKDVFDINPQMESFYMESVQLPSVTIDSVKSFASKVEGFTKSYPWAVEHERYPQIIQNIKSASLRLSITINDEWVGDTLIHF
jgi:hypothetical protein